MTLIHPWADVGVGEQDQDRSVVDETIQIYSADNTLIDSRMAAYKNIRIASAHRLIGD